MDLVTTHGHGAQTTMTKSAKIRQLATFQDCQIVPDIKLSMLQGCQYTLSGNLAKAAKIGEEAGAEWETALKTQFFDVKYICWGTPLDYENYEKTVGYWKEFIRKEDWV